MSDKKLIGGGRGRGNKSLDHDRNDLRRPHRHPPEVKPDSEKPKLNTDNSSNLHVRSSAIQTRSAMSCENASQVSEYSHMQGGIADNLPDVLSSISLDNGTPMSTLSADAPEFVPRYNSFTPQNLPPREAHHMPAPPVALLGTNNIPNMDIQNMPQIFGPQIKYLDHPVILQVNNIVVNLSMKPHKFDQIATKMTSILSWKVKEADLMKEIISVIFEQGVGEPNFRFNGGRLCQHLSKHVTQSYDGPPFKNLLLLKCEEEYSCRDYYLQTEPARLCGFTLFLADIFTHLLTSANQPLDKLREGICTLLKVLMCNPSSLTLKCVAQVLKGTGSMLDKGGNENVDVVMCRLKDVAMTAKIPVNIRSLLLSVVELRAANWGRRNEEPAPLPPPEESDIPHFGTVYYGPGGVIQRVEETDDDSASDTDDSYYGFQNQCDELEGEVAQAFEEFLKSQNNEIP